MNDELLDDFEPEKSPRRRYPAWLITLLVLFPLVLGIGTVLSFQEIESIMVNGGLLAAISVFLLLGGLFKRLFFVLLIGGAGLVVITCVFLFIWFFELSPTEAALPVPIVLSCFSGIVLLIYLWFLMGSMAKPGKND